MFTYFAIGIPLGLTASGQPGPFQAYLLSQSMKNGWTRTLPAALAPLVSDGPIILIIFVLLTRFPDWLLSIVKIGGGFFLLYLAWGAYQTFKTFDFSSQAETPPDETKQSILKAAMLNALGPGPYIFWGSVGGPLLVEGWGQAPVYGIGFLLGFYVAMIGGLIGLIVLFGVARKTGPTVSRLLTGLSSLLLLGFGVFQLWGGIADFIA